jgi:hypothetical protein
MPKFSDLLVGTEYTRRGVRYRKTAVSMATTLDGSEPGIGVVVMSDALVEVAGGTPVFIGPHQPVEHWAVHLASSPAARWP